jgi:CubicO group peptidase (beta-lactamase class C family)
MQALDLLEGWEATEATAGVVGGPNQTVLATHGDAARPSPWASVTKLVTALATLVAIERGAVDLDEPAGPPGATVRHLLAHASGLAFDDERALAEPGRLRIYSNRGYETLAGVVAERVGREFDRHLREAVLEPLGMDATALVGSPAEGIAAPLVDMLRLAAELLAPTLIRPETLAMATTVAFPGLAGVLPGFGRQDPLDWGLGFELRDAKSPHWTGRRNSPATFGHFGRSGSFLWVDPEAELSCAALSRRDFGPWAAEAWPALSDAVLEELSGPRG